MQKQILYPKIIPRLIASLIDLTIISFVSLIIIKFLVHIGLIKATQKIYSTTSFNSFQDLLIYITSKDFLLTSGLTILIQVLFLFLYFIAFWYYTNTTPGKYIMRIKIVKHKDSTKPKLSQLLIRFFVGYIIFWIIPLIGIINIIFSIFARQRRAWHDKISGILLIKY